MSVKVIAHRGWWTIPEEQNTLVAFARAFDAGIGVELDVRDCEGRLVVSHDPPKEFERPIPFSSVLELLGDEPNVLAVNVKSCGLAPWFARCKAPENWFFFDLPPHEYEEYKRLVLPVDTVYAVSKELVNRDDDGQWQAIRRMVSLGGELSLITDLVAEAMEFFK